MKSMCDIFRSYGVLDEQGRHVNGTDKQTNHNYGDAYESLFYGSKLVDVKVTNTRTEPMHERTSKRDQVKLMMEVGVADGSSLCAWRDIFPNALCVGMDIHHSDKAHGDRIEFHYGDQCNKEHCERAAAGRQFDFIVEDATHKLPNTFLTLFWLWPFVRPGGLYVVEEWEGASGDRNRIRALFPNVDIVGTSGPHIEDEPLIVLRKLL